MALGELSLTSLHLSDCSTYIAEELGMKLWQGLARTVPWLVRVTHTITRTTPLKAHSCRILEMASSSMATSLSARAALAGARPVHKATHATPASTRGAARTGRAVQRVHAITTVRRPGPV